MHFFHENYFTLIYISLNCSPVGQITNQVMAWHRSGTKPLPDPMMTQFTYAYASLDLNVIAKRRISSSRTIWRYVKGQVFSCREQTEAANHK